MAAFKIFKNKVQIWKPTSGHCRANAKFPRALQLSSVKKLPYCLQHAPTPEVPFKDPHHHPHSPKAHRPHLKLQTTSLNLWMVRNLRYHFSFAVLALLFALQTVRETLCYLTEKRSTTWTLNCLRLLLAPYLCPLTISDYLEDEGLYRCMLSLYKSL